jgi:hypothetical protein
MPAAPAAGGRPPLASEDRMKKLRLDLDKLGVHSFETGEVLDARGTVAGAAADPVRPPCGTRAPDCWCTAVDPALTIPIL